MPPVHLAVAAYSAQILIVVAVATTASILLRLTLPTARLVYWRAVGVLCLALPLFSPLGAEGPSASAVFGTVAAGGGASGAPAPAVPWMATLVGGIVVTGAAARLAWLLLGACRLGHVRRRGTPAALGTDVEALTAAIAPRTEFRWTDELRQPVTFGLRHPVVLLPRRFSTLSAEAQRSVACHELLHVARRDWLWVVIEEHVRALFWFHPAVWWLLEQVQLSREQVIDRQVVTRMASRRAYMGALMAFADDGAAVSPSIAFLRRRHLKFRLQQLSKEPEMSVRRLTATMAALVIVMGTAAGSVARALPLDIPALRLQAGSPASLEVRLAETAPAGGLTEARTPGSDAPIYLHPSPLVTGADVTEARVIGGDGSPFSVAVAFSDEASSRIMSVSQAHLGRPVAIVLDRQVIAVLTLKSPIGDSAIISGPFTEDEAKRLAEGLVASPAASRPAGAPKALQANSRNGVTLPEVVQKVDPEYTRAAMDAGIEGEVILSVVVQADGTVGDVTITRSLDAVYGLDERAVAAVQQWEFRPAMANGKPVAVEVTIEMRFTLK